MIPICQSGGDACDSQMHALALDHVHLLQQDQKLVAPIKPRSLSTQR